MLPYSFDLVDCQVLAVTRKFVSYAMDLAQVTAASGRQQDHP